jgi:hypothetical protein
MIDPTKTNVLVIGDHTICPAQFCIAIPVGVNHEKVASREMGRTTYAYVKLRTLASHCGRMQVLGIRKEERTKKAHILNTRARDMMGKQLGELGISGIPGE